MAGAHARWRGGGRCVLSRGAALGLALLLAGCEDWERLACIGRHVCGGDAGPFVLVGGLALDGGATVVGVTGSAGLAVVALEDAVVTYRDGGFTRSVLGAAPLVGVSGLGAGPTVFFAATRDGQVTVFTDDAPPGPGSTSRRIDGGGPAAAIVAYPEATTFDPLAAVFFRTSASTTSVGLGQDLGERGRATEPCELSDMRGGLASYTTSVVAGTTSSCSGVPAGSGGAVTLWPRDAINPPPLSLGSGASSVRVGSSSFTAAIAFERDSSIWLATVPGPDGGVSALTRSAGMSISGGAAVSQVLADVLPVDGYSPYEIIYALNNRTDGTLTVGPAPGGPGVTVGPGHAALVFTTPGTDPPLFEVQLLTPARPFTSLRLGMATTGYPSLVWLAATCEPSSAGESAGDSYCPPGRAGHLALLQLTSR